jgi:hypothetical protein
MKMRGKIMTQAPGLLTSTLTAGYKYLVMIQESYL